MTRRQLIQLFSLTYAGLYVPKRSYFFFNGKKYQVVETDTVWVPADMHIFRFVPFDTSAPIYYNG